MADDTSPLAGQHADLVRQTAGEIAALRLGSNLLGPRVSLSSSELLRWLRNVALVGNGDTSRCDTGLLQQVLANGNRLCASVPVARLGFALFDPSLSELPRASREAEEALGRLNEVVRARSQAASETRRMVGEVAQGARQIWLPSQTQRLLAWLGVAATLAVATVAWWHPALRHWTTALPLLTAIVVTAAKPRAPSSETAGG